MLEKSTLVVRSIVITLLWLVLVGCGGSTGMTMSSYNRVNNGMTEAEVAAILGQGEEQASSSINIPGKSISVPGGGSVSFAGMSSSAKVKKWQDGMKVITIEFMDGKVMGKAQFGL